MKDEKKIKAEELSDEQLNEASGGSAPALDKEEKRCSKGIYDSLTEEQKEKAKACKTTDDFLKLAGEGGIKHPDETPDSVAGGALPINP